MPGILPMKVIKVGTSAQSRIAQACDRCRSKKIRCDGIRPCCSQCSNVGFECKTSDKLSRRAFPRGYTESLEDRVRSLESEVRELKDLLDEKDEKIDILSKMHSNRRSPSRASAKSPAAPEASEEPTKEDTFRVQASPLLLISDTSDSYFMGASSGRAFIDAFKRKIQESGKSCADMNTDAFLKVQCQFPAASDNPSPTSSVPPRLFSDRCVNVFFQEWAPLFPVLHRNTFLRLYEEYNADPDAITDHHKLAQLHLVFGISGLSGSLPDSQSIAICEHAWQRSLDKILMTNTISTLQLLVLAVIYCILKGDYQRLIHYKGVAVGLAHRLGLHQSQKRFSLGALTLETRKKVFWSLYTVDCFSAAMLGLPKLFKETDIHCENPADIDDEYVTEKGFLPTLPGESSKISSALALFQAARILSKVLEQNYPAAATHELSLQSLSMLEAEINEWSDDLPQHLKLTFVQDKPSTNVTGSRSALLSLAYYYILTLVHRPTIGSTLGSKAYSSVISVAESSKHMIQIVQLLEERNMSFSFCINKCEMLTLCGLSLMYQSVDLKQEGKLMKDGQQYILAVVKDLQRANAAGADDFERLVTSILPAANDPPQKSRHGSDNNLPRPTFREHSIQRVSSSPNHDGLTHSRRSTLPEITINGLQRHSSDSRSPAVWTPDLHGCLHENPGNTPLAPSLPSIEAAPERVPSNQTKPNLDYLSLGNTPVGSQPHSPVAGRNTHTPIFPGRSSATSSVRQKSTSVTASQWANLLGNLDGGQANIYDAVYGGPAINLQFLGQQHASTGSSDDWSPKEWDLANLNMDDFDLGLGAGPGTAHSVLSFSEESLSSGDDFGAAEFPISTINGSGHMGTMDYRDLGERFLLDVTDGNIGT